MLITRPKLWSFLRHHDNAGAGMDDAEDYAAYKLESHGEAPETLLTAEEYAYLKQQDLKPILIDQHVSENHLGGDDVVGVVDEVLEQITFSCADSDRGGSSERLRSASIKVSTGPHTKT